MGLNSANELYIKTAAQDDSLGGANPPSLLINSSGTIFLNGATSAQQSGFLYEFSTVGITQYNRDAANLSPLGPNYWLDPTTGNERWE